MMPHARPAGSNSRGRRVRERVRTLRISSECFMSQRFPLSGRPGGRRAGTLPLPIGLALIAAGSLLLTAGESQPKPKPPAPRVPVVQLASPAGTLLARPTPRQPWQVVASGKDVCTRDLLLALPGLRANLEARGAVRLSLLGALPEASGLPVLESAVVLHQNPAADLDLSLNRGRILLIHRKAKGPARVRVRFRDQAWELELSEPETEVALERINHWLPGVPFEKNPRAGQGPSSDVYLLLLKGRILLNAGTERRTLSGPMVFQWSAERGALGPIPLKQVPGWIAAADTGDRALAAAAERLRQRLAEGEVARVLGTTLAGRDAPTRVLAVYSAGATDDLPLLLTALRDAQHAEVREAAVVAFRHWISRAAGQDQKLVEVLVKDGYRPGQAEIFLQLLHTFSRQDRDRPETYETLIDYLNHDRLAIRELAHWQLTRLVPPGRTIAFNPAASADERARAVAAWRRLIPAGKVPPAK
jgi:hypothetical protein